MAADKLSVCLLAKRNNETEACFLKYECTARAGSQQMINGWMKVEGRDTGGYSALLHQR